MIGKDIIPDDLKCVIFDMDGVLYDSMKNHEITWRKSFQSEGIDFPGYEAYMHEGRPGHETIAYVFKEYVKKEATQEDKDRVYNEKVRLMSKMPAAEKMPMVKELINLLREREISIWVVTGSKQPTLLNRLSQDFEIAPSHIVSARDVTQGKPHPQPYLMAIQGSGFIASQCMVVENAPLGVRSSKAAGITTIAVNTGVLKDEVLSNEGADIVLPDTRSLYAYMVAHFKTG
ncbi:haloacid dehalogenase superfamily, subfamily IA, variant 3 with third motif having DD or ED [Saccharicrinis carchari]|uniref:Haloacid dehalogenase superfamily, subfamily IA, variant 3 with third motif having DD or ED n=1 Tax=Saccharicrinis carchari TaxID=1168039 RepID=A0A521DZQ6_SACCC|nr:HAD-IA family hydrolase [Saccharicrinis carchari]SMO76340.1 haloacid dehalogenase superfamily, subfamily IA, variant 3 with third motif having DD or ED [Saccharicrinis carchari]